MIPYLWDDTWLKLLALALRDLLIAFELCLTALPIETLMASGN